MELDEVLDEVYNEKTNEEIPKTINELIVELTDIIKNINKDTQCISSHIGVNLKQETNKNDLLENEMLYYYHFSNILMQNNILSILPDIDVQYKSIEELNLRADSFIVVGNLNEIQKALLPYITNLKVIEIKPNTSIIDLLNEIENEENYTNLIVLKCVLCDYKIKNILIDIILKHIFKINDKLKVEMNKGQFILTCENIKQLNLRNIDFPVYYFK